MRMMVLAGVVRGAKGDDGSKPQGAAAAAAALPWKPRTGMAAAREGSGQRRAAWAVAPREAERSAPAGGGRRAGGGKGGEGLRSPYAALPGTLSRP